MSLILLKYDKILIITITSMWSMAFMHCHFDFNTYNYAKMYNK